MFSKIARPSDTACGAAGQPIGTDRRWTHLKTRTAPSPPERSHERPVSHVRLRREEQTKASPPAGSLAERQQGKARLAVGRTCSTAPRSVSMMMMSALERVTSETQPSLPLDPISSPTSACDDASTSFTPSPTNPTVHPCACTHAITHASEHTHASDHAQKRHRQRRLRAPPLLRTDVIARP